MFKRDIKAERFLDSCIRVLEYNDKILRILDAKLFNTRKNLIIDYIEDIQREIDKMREIITDNT